MSDVSGVGESRRIKPTAMRRAIMRKVTAAKQQIPHIYLWRQVAVDPLLVRRKQYQPTAPSVTACLVWAAARALAANPILNASVGEGELIYHGQVHLGVAVALPDGLVMPVLRDADRLSPLEIHLRLIDLTERARARRLQPEEYQGSTFSVSNLGTHGIDGFAAIIQPPEVAILALGRFKPAWVKTEEGWGERTVVEATLSADHRLVDGAPAAAFLESFATALTQFPGPDA